jgi:NAD(P)-dependent dehydrogenase (short-subunit alcohol dehydrogenase family)
MNPFSLENKTILVTGATSGIGRQLVDSIISMNGKVIAVGRNTEMLMELQEKHDNSIVIISCDLTNQEDVSLLAEKCPAIDGLVNSAGIVKSQPIRYLIKEKIEETFEINFYAVIELIRQLDKAKKIAKKSSIVFISSIAAQFPRKGGAGYSASKAAIEALMKVTAMEYAHRGIRANAIAPAMVKTPMYEEAKELASHAIMEAHIQQYPLGIGEPQDIANAVIYLLSDASKWMTGSTITLDGGLLLGY